MFFFIACTDKTYKSDDPDITMRSGVLLYKGSLLTGVVESYIPALDETHYTTYENGIQHGEYKVVHQSGRLLQKMYYENGEKHGISKTWHLNGQQKSHAEFKEGHYINERVEWFDNGQIAVYEKYSLEGKILVSKKWYREGKIYMNLSFQEDGSSYGMPGSKLCDPIESKKNP